MSSRSALFALLVVAWAPPARAQPHERVEVMFELAVGDAFAVADDDYQKFLYPGYGRFVPERTDRPTAFGRVGVFLWSRNRRFAMVPEIEVGGSSMIRSPVANVFAVAFDRVRGLGGGRLFVALGRFGLYARLMLGVDHAEGSNISYRQNGVQFGAQADTAFTIEPGVGAQVTVVGPLAIGVYGGFPIVPAYHLDLITHFEAIDFDLLGVLQLRL